MYACMHACLRTQRGYGAQHAVAACRMKGVFCLRDVAACLFQEVLTLLHNLPFSLDGVSLTLNSSSAHPDFRLAAVGLRVSSHMEV